MASLDATAVSLLRDPQYLLRLHHKIVQRLVQRDASTSVRGLAPLFTQIDMRYRDRTRAAPTESWHLRCLLRQIFPASALSDRELSVLLALLPFDEPGAEGDVRVSPVAVLHCLRQLCPDRASMLLEVLRAVHAAPRQRPSASPCGRALAAQRHSNSNSGSGSCTMEAQELVDYLVGSFGLTLSAALFLMDYCAASGTSAGSSAGSSVCMDLCGGPVAVDGAYMYALLYRRPLPADVHYALLMSVFAECVADPKREGRSGTRALVAELRRVQLDGGGGDAPSSSSGSRNGQHRMHQPNGQDNNGHEKDDANEHGGDAGVCMDAVDIAHRCLSPKAFESLCAALGVGLPLSDVRRLFYYLRDEARDSLPVHTLVREFIRHFPPSSSPSLFCILSAAVRRFVTKAGGMLALPKLFLALPLGPLPVDALVGALRAAGVPDAVSDAELERLRFAGRDRAGVVLVLCGSAPARREALVRQLFEQLCEAGRGATDTAAVLARFSPEKAGDALVGSGEEWRETMAKCFAGAQGRLSYEQFAFFWCAVSAACEDDSVFTMILWRCFAMHANKK